MKNIFLLIGAIALLASCVEQKKENETMNKESVETKQSFPEIKEGDVVAGINLTVAEGKRLIAKGIANDLRVKEKLKKGMVIITSGSTNTYIAEELANLKAPHGSFLTGNIIPHGKESITKGLERVPNIVIIDGKVADINFEDALKKTRKGDIIFKGANLLNYERKQTAVCIGAADGGTVSRIREYTAVENRGLLIVPIGLEKEVHGDLNDYEKLFENKTEQLSYVPRVWVHQNGEVFTEIEAIKNFGAVNVYPFAAGGLAGREGGISLAVYGSKEEVSKVLDVISSIQGEDPFAK